MKSLFVISLLTACLNQPAFARYEDFESNYVEKLYNQATNFIQKNLSSQQDPITSPLQAITSLFSCAACEQNFFSLQSLVHGERFKYFFHSLGYDICYFGAKDFAQGSMNTCMKMWDISNQEGKVYDSLITLIQPAYLCEVKLGFCNKKRFALDSVDSFAERVLSNKPDFLKHDDFQDKLHKQIFNQNRKTISLVQFTDLHLDLDYVVGANNKCSNIICCRKENGIATEPQNAAGPYGSVGFCDIPVSVLDKMTNKINELAPDSLFWTGDATPHDLWNLSQEHVERYQKFLTDYMKKNLSQWRTFPLEGNHDFGQVFNSQDFQNIDPVIPFLAQQWKDWLDEDALKEFSIHGFYSQKFATSDGTVYEKVNVIAINTEAGYNANFFLLSNRNDPGNQLAWLEQKLAQMEAKGEIAILIGHHPVSSSSVIYEWSARFRVLMDRYQHIVRLSFFGHMHEEQYNSIRSWDSNKIIGTIFWSGAVTTYTTSYPSFRRFILDAETMLPVKVETYRLDPYLKDPEFVLDHELGEYYRLPDLSPESFKALSIKLKQDEELALKYVRTKFQQGNDSLQSCDEKCRLQVYCDTTSTTYSDSLDCQGQEENTTFFKAPLNTAKKFMWEYEWYSTQQETQI